MSFLGNFVTYLAQALTFAIVARLLISWFPMATDNPVVTLLVQVTEPILAPLRLIIPRFGLLDLTPLIAIVLLQLIGNTASRIL
jgi:YggT family protein